MRQRGVQRDHAHLHLARQQIGDHRAGALVRNMARLDARLLQEHLAGQMNHGAVAGGRVVVFVRPGLQQCDQFLDVARRHLGVDYQHQRRRAQHADRRDVLDRVERHRLEHAGIDRMVVRHHAERGAVRGRLDHSGRTGDAARAGHVLDDDRLAERLAKRRRSGPDDRIDARTRADWQDQPDRLAGPRLRLGGAERIQRRRAEHAERDGRGRQFDHVATARHRGRDRTRAGGMHDVVSGWVLFGRCAAACPGCSGFPACLAPRPPR